MAEYATMTITETIAGKSTVALGTEPILHMRAVTRSKAIPRRAFDDIRLR